MFRVWIVLAGLAVMGAGEPAMIDLSGNGFAFAKTGQGRPAEWAVQRDSSAPNAVLVQTSGDQTDYRFPLAIYEKVSAANVDVSVRFKAVAGRVDRAGGLAVRLSDPDNYYVVRANALEDNVNFYRVVKGSRREIQGASTKVASDVWHTLGLKADGDVFTISFDGKTLFTVTDRSFPQAGPQAGKVALWTKADSVTRFDALTIRTLP
jgi:hypothetical protein